MATKRRDSRIAELRALASGAKKHLKNVPMTIANEDFSGAELLARVNVSLDSAMSVQEAWSALADAITADAKVQAKQAEFLAGLRRNLRTRYSQDTTTLGEFGLAPRKKREPLASDAELLRVLRLRATREKRKTRGKRQKAAIKGNVSGVVITPVLRGATKER